jgi:uncharacterized membrane protein/rubredoxin
MSQLLRCKPCGYIIREKDLGQVCPACGMPKSAFEPYKENISPKRKFILSLDLHPIAVHFPQAFATILPIILILNILFTSYYAKEIVIVSKFLSVLLPFAVIGAIISGLIDGKVRFKKIRTPALIKKIIIGCIFLLFSVSICFISIFSDFGSRSKLYVLLLSVACVLCSIILGTIGKKLMYAKLKGS